MTHQKIIIRSKHLLTILIIQFLLISTLADGQQGKLPPFRMLQSNGKIFKAEDLPLDKPIIIIYFSPECDDCQHLMNNILSRISEFNSVSISMITNFSIESVSNFVTRNNLEKYSNIYAGTEGNSLFVMNYYNIDQIPFVALYTKDGDLVKKYIKEIDLNDLLGHLKNMF